MKRVLMVASLIGCLSAGAGEIIIIQPEDPSKTRSERNLDRSMSKARQQAGVEQPVTVIEEGSQPGTAEQAGEMLRGARSRRGAGADNPDSSDNTVIIMRAAPPPTGAEKAVSKARGYAGTKDRMGRNCGEVATSVGTIGEGEGATQSAKVIEKGNSAVNPNCR